MARTKHKVIFQVWNKKSTKVISLMNYKEPWKENGNPPMFCIRNNGGRRKKGDKCFDFYIHIGYLIFNYCNYDLQKNVK